MALERCCSLTLLPPDKTIDSDLYCHQLMRLKQEVEQKRPDSNNRMGVVFHHDNAGPHTSLATQQLLREFDWEVLMYRSYSPKPCTLRFLPVSVFSQFFGGIRLTSREDCQH
ncbi:Mariner Mos1 transposase [Eumeta japonica]|uniref:Mariner Mos1 transposase n=1 Tax=Eumeta variegata TaxID=151549 RepID=A0A4C1SWJ4_EUMVA|nr:Mariner Mos1 transposase [Eumeta japonica]